MKSIYLKTAPFSLMVVFFLLALDSCSKDHSHNEEDKRYRHLSCKAPSYLKAGDKIALISPSYHTDMSNVEKTAEVLTSWGFVPVIGPNVGKIYAGRYAGTLEERVSDIKWALNDPEIKAIICNRGGYGSIQLIDYFTPKDFSSSPKWIVGFSDITTLLEMFSASGVMSIHGTMSSFIAATGGIDDNSQLMKGILEGKIPKYNVPSHPQNIQGKGVGTLVGGNICTFAPNLNTWVDVSRYNNIILFIEEVEESMHNIDRQFNILLFRGILSRCRGVILGEFTDCGSEFTYGSVEAMLNDYIKEYNIPLLCGFPAGHGDINLPLIMGATTTIDVTPSGAIISYDLSGEQVVINTADIEPTKVFTTQQIMQLAGKVE